MVCCGLRGERKMLCIWQETGAGLKYGTAICVGCCEEVFPQWLKLMRDNK